MARTPHGHLRALACRYYLRHHANLQFYWFPLCHYVFISYLCENYPKVYDAFIDSGTKLEINDPVTGEKIDIPHWAATINAYYYDTTIVDNDFANAVAESYIDDFAGWLGDYLSMLYRMDSESIRTKEGIEAAIGFHDYFRYSDVLADFDALNIYYKNTDLSMTISFPSNKLTIFDKISDHE